MTRHLENNTDPFDEILNGVHKTYQATAELVASFVSNQGLYVANIRAIIA